MSRTTHHVHSTPDPIRTQFKLERKARPAGRLAPIVAIELAEDEDDARIEALAVKYEPADWDDLPGEQGYWPW